MEQIADTRAVLATHDFKYLKNRTGMHHTCSAHRRYNLPILAADAAIAEEVALPAESAEAEAHEARLAEREAAGTHLGMTFECFDLGDPLGIVAAMREAASS